MTQPIKKIARMQAMTSKPNNQTLSNLNKSATPKTPKFYEKFFFNLKKKKPK